MARRHWAGVRPSACAGQAQALRHPAQPGCGVAHDGQQRVQRQRHQRRHGADGAQQRNQHRQQGQRRHGLQQAGEPAAPSRAVAACGNTQHPQRHGHQRRQRHRNHHQHQVLAGEPRQVGPEQLGPQAAAGRVGHGGAVQRAGAAVGAAVALPAALGAARKSRAITSNATPCSSARAFMRDHRGLVDAAFQRLQRGPGRRKARGHVQPVQHQRVVARKVAAVVVPARAGRRWSILASVV